MPEAWAWGVNYRTLPGKPSKLTKLAPPSRTAYVFACVNVNTGDLLDCPFTLKITELAPPVDDLDNNGGHAHSNPGRSLGDLLSVPNGVRAQVKSGSTANGWAAVAHELPEFSGKIITVADLKVPILPSGYWRCVDGYGGYRCLDNQTWRTETTTDVRVPGLVDLPVAPGLYIRCGVTAGCTSDPKIDPSHPSPFNGKPDLVTNAAFLSSFYRAYYSFGPSAQRLRISDISLPKGGRFDIKSDWGGSHKSHRVGTSVDISRSALLDKGGTTYVDQELLDNIAEDTLGLSRLTETSASECPTLQPGEPPCIHIDLE